MQAMHAASTRGAARPAVSSCPSPMIYPARQPVQPRAAPLGGSVVPYRNTHRQQRKEQLCAAVPQPVADVAADVSYYLQLASFAVLGGFVIYFTLNYVGLNITLNKAEKAKQKKAEEEAAKKKKGGFFGLGKK